MVCLFNTTTFFPSSHDFPAVLYATHDASQREKGVSESTVPNTMVSTAGTLVPMHYCWYSALQPLSHAVIGFSPLHLHMIVFALPCHMHVVALIEGKHVGVKVQR
jgi:hypothetical protein